MTNSLPIIVKDPGYWIITSYWKNFLAAHALEDKKELANTKLVNYSATLVDTGGVDRIRIIFEKEEDMMLFLLKYS